MLQALLTDMENSFNNTKEKLVSTPKEVAYYLGKSVSWVYKNQSVLGVRKLGGSLFFPPKEELYEHLFCKEKGVEVRLHSEGQQIHQGLVQKKAGRPKSGHIEKRGIEKPGTGDRSAGDANRHGILGSG